MADIERQIDELATKLAELRRQYSQMNNEMILMENQLKSLRSVILPNTQPTAIERSSAPANFDDTNVLYVHKLQQNIMAKTLPKPKRSFLLNRETEDFIGTNVISKIGILVTIIGVFVGAKYAIDNELVSPLTRIIAGYISAAALVSIAIKLKKKYQYFSAVLIGGGLAVTYFITYIAYSFYGLFPMWLAFIVMVATTFAAVAIALWYDQKVIALTGQIAAYAIPFLLGDKSGNVFGLFSYISVINIGLLVLSFKKDWKIVYHIAFFLTSLIYFFWLVTGNQIAKHFSAGLLFLTINFFTFYITFLSYKILKKEQYHLREIGILLLNALFYFFLGAYLISESFQNDHFLTWFTVSNSVIHFAAGFLIFRLKLADKTVFQFVSGLGILFVTVAVPIELDGSWVTLLWIVEATTLFYIATANRRIVYLDIALPLIVIAVLSFLQDLSYNHPFPGNLNAVAGYNAVPFANINFALSLVVCACLGYISYASLGKPFPNLYRNAAVFYNKIVPAAFLFLLYFTFYSEIRFAWDKIINARAISNISGVNTTDFILQSLTLILFSCLYVAAWLAIGKRIKRGYFFYLLIFLAAVANAVFLTQGLYLTGELRENYLSKNPAISLSALLLTRYISLAVVATLWSSARKSILSFKPSYSFLVAFSCFFNLTLITFISNEFINWMDISGYQNQYKLGLSLIGGAYALALIFAGIIKNKKHLRISAMLLFSVVLIKLFFYDLASLSTLSKTIVLVLLGILLLFASFLYNKYKDLLSGKEEGR